MASDCLAACCNSGFNFCCFSFTMIRFFFSHIFNTFDKHLFISMVIFKIGWSIRSWLSDYISFSFYKSYCRHDIYWILVAFMIAASALIKVSRLHGLYRHLYTQLIYWHCVVMLYCIPMWIYWINVSESWILNPGKSYQILTNFAIYPVQSLQIL